MENQLRDIKPLLEVPDYSYYVVLGGLSLLLLVALLGVVWIVRRLLQARRKSQRERDFEALQSVDWEDAKRAAYQVTFLGRRLVHDRRSREIFGQLLPMLEPYKYKREVPRVDTETLKLYNLLVHVIDEQI